MGRTPSVDDAGSLSGWLHVTPTRQRIRRRRAPAVVGALRFAFYGRISTGEYQDATSSRAWQLDSARQTIAGVGRIVVEYFDVGCSRRLPWTERPKAAALLAAVTSPDRPFDAVVIGEYERAFHGDQLTHIAAALASCGVQLWLPETHGPVDLSSPIHQALMMLLGHQSNREILRARFRTIMAMTAQAREQNRHLGDLGGWGVLLRLQGRRHDLVGMVVGQAAVAGVDEELYFRVPVDQLVDAFGLDGGLVVHAPGSSRAGPYGAAAGGRGDGCLDRVLFLLARTRTSAGRVGALGGGGPESRCRPGAPRGLQRRRRPARRPRCTGGRRWGW